LSNVVQRVKGKGGKPARTAEDVPELLRSWRQFSRQLLYLTPSCSVRGAGNSPARTFPSSFSRSTHDCFSILRIPVCLIQKLRFSVLLLAAYSQSQAQADIGF